MAAMAGGITLPRSFGDCFADALAKTTGGRLKGKDFPQTYRSGMTVRPYGPGPETTRAIRTCFALVAVALFFPTRPRPPRRWTTPPT